MTAGYGTPSWALVAGLLAGGLGAVLVFGGRLLGRRTPRPGLRIVR